MNNLDLFLSNEYTVNFLNSSYDNFDSAVQNADRFISYLSTGKNQINIARENIFEVQPILAFYGLVNLLKACALKNDHEFPVSCSLLAHGVSTRKRRKIDFIFFKDEVKVQRNGFFPYISTVVFNSNIPTFKKFPISELLASIPEIDYLFEFYKLDKNKCDIPELLVHYLILYDLSMISRYEVHWWTKLISNHKNYDYPFIKSYLDVFFSIYESLIFKTLNG